MRNIQNNRQATAILFLHAQTPLHPGSGTALGVVDLPVQRERHTQWPLIPGSSLKGVLRDVCREATKDRYDDEYDEGQRLRRTRRQVANEDDELLTAAFGPGKVNESAAHAGALSVTDARILAFPVRSLRGVFAWVTCPAVLQRLERDLGITEASQEIGPIPDVADRDEVALCAAESPLLIPAEGKLVLEEIEFTRGGDFPAAQQLAEYVTSDAPTRDRFRTHLALISDNDFGHFVRHATEIIARIRLNYERKTVDGSALFYQEFLPAETVFYAIVFANASRRQGADQEARAMLDYLTANVAGSHLLQIGGDETTGKGFCTVTWVREKEAQQ